MVKNYFKIAFRNLMRHKRYVIVNVLGLSVSLALCIVAWLNYRYSEEFNIMHTQAEQIVRITGDRTVESKPETIGISPLPLALAAEAALPEVIDACRITRESFFYKQDAIVSRASMTYVDSSFVHLFDFPLKYGDSHYLGDPSYIFLSQEKSEQLYGDLDPFGKILQIRTSDQGFRPFTIGGVFEELPKNSSIQFDFLANIDHYIETNLASAQDWASWVDGSFLLLEQEANLAALSTKLDAFIDIQNQANERIVLEKYGALPLLEISKAEPNLRFPRFAFGQPKASVMGTSLTAFLILLLACFNFTNTSISFAGSRLKEIGIRKVVGGTRIELVLQLMGEHLLIILFSLILGLGLAELLIPRYNDLMPGVELSLSWSTHSSFYLFLVVLLLGVGVLAGGYPSLYISSFTPVSILRDKLKFKGANLFTRFLVGGQFFITAYTLVGMIVFAENAEYQLNLDKGYRIDQNLVIPLENNASYEAVRDLALEHPSVMAVAGTKNILGYRGAEQTITVAGKPYPVNSMGIGHDYVEMMGLRVMQGRSFERQYEQDATQHVLVNEKMLEYLGWEQAIGQQLKWQDQTYTVVGVIGDFYDRMLVKGAEIKPTFMHIVEEKGYAFATVQAPADELAKVQQFIHHTWHRVDPSSPYLGYFQEELYMSMIQVNEVINIIDIFVTVISLWIAAMGLYTLVSLNILKRLKEIGIRKILGASANQIAQLIQKDFSLLLLTSSIGGIIVGYFVMDLLLGIVFEYHIEISWLSLALSLLGIILLVLISIGGKVYQASQINPVDQLRDQ